jgi:hypothetical protein
MGCTLPQLIKHRRRRGFLSVLREENLVSEDLVNDVNKLDISSTVNFEHSEHLHVLPLGTLHSGIKAGPWSYNRPLQVPIHIETRAFPSPYKGTCFCGFGPGLSGTRSRCLHYCAQLRGVRRISHLSADLESPNRKVDMQMPTRPSCLGTAFPFIATRT